MDSDVAHVEFKSSADYVGRTIEIDAVVSAEFNSAYANNKM
jgi:hypothetical protein